MADRPVVPPPPPRRPTDRLFLVALFSGSAVLPLFGLLGAAWIQFDGDWDGPLGLINGSSGKVWIVIAEAWTYLVPLIVGLALAVATSFGCLVAASIRDARHLSRPRV